MSTTPARSPSASITAFLNANGVRVILRNPAGEDVAEGTIGYEHGKGTVGGKAVSVYLPDNSDSIELTVLATGTQHVLSRGTGASYYCYLDAERQTISMAEARKRMRIAKPTQTQAPQPGLPLDDDIPF